MIKFRNFGGGTQFPLNHTERGQGTLTCSLIRLPKGGLRWYNISDKGGVMNG